MTLPKLFGNLQKAAQVEEPVLLVGETGVGKVSGTAHVHELSQRAKAPLHTFRTTGLEGNEASARLFGEEGLTDISRGDYGHAFGGAFVY